MSLGHRRLYRLAALCALPILAVAGLVLATAPSSVAGESDTHALVRIDSGFVRGTQNGDVKTYLGIPYAAPPTGDLRWRPPRPVQPWHGVRDATQFGPSCPQQRLNNPFLPPGPLSEDCLYLNVYAPATRHGERARGHNRHHCRHPVLVWIHGGGLVQDAARNYDGTKLADDGAVVVTINYRLGALGFLADRALATRRGGPNGNYGWMDQQAALRWVQRNIAGFGGDPRNVTIAGQSAGGLSVLAHLVSPGSQGFFQHAIVQSGAFALRQRSLARAEAAGSVVANAVGCSHNTANCLRQASVADLVKNYGVAIPGYVDGSVLRESIGNALSGGRFAHVPVLNGITHDEERLFVDALGIAVSRGTDVPIPYRPIDDTNYQANIAAVLGVSTGQAARIATEYPISAYSPVDDTPADAAFSTLVSDANFACPALQVDRWTSRRVPTFAYQFNDDNAPFVLAPPGHFPAVATHGSELPYLFDLPNTPFPAILGTDQQRLASTMRMAWVNFAAYGNPSTRSLRWPPFSYGAGVMSLVPPHPMLQRHFAATHRCGFWAAEGHR